MRQHAPFKTTGQEGFSTFAAIGALVGIGIVFLLIFLLSAGGNKALTGSGGQQGATPATGQTGDTGATSSEPPFIRLPDNSNIYASKTYGFMFAYPDSFGELTDGTVSNGGTSIFRAESALANQKPIGAGGTALNGRLGVFVFTKADFKLSVSGGSASVGPVTTGNDTTWKVVSRDTASDSDLSVGDAYPVRSSRSQTGIAVFDFTTQTGNQILSRSVFEAGNHYVMIALPTISKTSGTVLSDQDLAAYTIITANMVKTVRLPAGGAAAKAAATPPAASPAPAANGSDAAGGN